MDSFTQLVTTRFLHSHPKSYLLITSRGLRYRIMPPRGLYYRITPLRELCYRSPHHATKGAMLPYLDHYKLLLLGARLMYIELRNPLTLTPFFSLSKLVILIL